MSEHVVIVALVSFTVLTVAALAYRFEWSKLPSTRDALDAARLVENIATLQTLLSDVAKRQRELEAASIDRDNEIRRIVGDFAETETRLKNTLELAREEHGRMLMSRRPS